MEVAGASVVIDLGLERGEPPTYASPSRSTVPPWFPAVVLALLVLVCATGSVAPAQPPLRTAFRLQLGSADAYTLTDDGQLLVQSYGELSSYDLSSGRLRWQVGQSAPSYRLRIVAGLVLLRPYPLFPGISGTTAISTADGVAQWRRPDNVVTLGDTSALVAVTSVRSLIGSARRVEGPVDAVDPRTGTTRWTITVPNTAVLVGVPGPGDTGTRLLVVRDDRTAHLHDLDTGAEVASATLPGADYDPQNPAVVGGRVLLLYPGENGAHLTAYDAGTLTPVWSVFAGEADTVQPCAKLACVSGPDGTRGVDPATGAVRWARPGWHSVDQEGADIVAYAKADEGDPIGVIDANTGTVQVQLTGWRPIAGAGDGDLLVTRPVDRGTRTIVAVARPGQVQPGLLAELPSGTGDCQAAPGRLVCRSMFGDVVVWAYRPKG